MQVRGAMPSSIVTQLGPACVWFPHRGLALAGVDKRFGVRLNADERDDLQLLLCMSSERFFCVTMALWQPSCTLAASDVPPTPPSLCALTYPEGCSPQLCAAATPS